MLMMLRRFIYAAITLEIVRRHYAPMPPVAGHFRHKRAMIRHIIDIYAAATERYFASRLLFTLIRFSDAPPRHATLISPPCRASSERARLRYFTLRVTPPITPPAEPAATRFERAAFF